LNLLTDLVEGHLDALGPLLQRRAAAEEARGVTGLRLRELEERIAGHFDALHIFGADLPDVLAPFVADEPVAVTAVLAAADHPAALPGVATLPAGDLAAIRPLLGPTLRIQLRSTPGPRAAWLTGRPAERAWFADSDPQVRAWAWASPWTDAPELGDEPERLVRDAWRRAWIMRRDPRWRTGPDDEVLPWAARLATAAEQPGIEERLWAANGSWRWEALAALGRPVDAERLIHHLSDPDPATALAAAAAFTALTGADIAGTQRVTIGAAEDAFAAEFLSQAWLPDPARARRAFADLPVAVRAAARMQGGRIVHPDTAATDLALDRFEIASATLRRAWHA
jgi:hypothetical protein